MSPQRIKRLSRKLSVVYLLFIGSSWTNTSFLSLNGVLRPWSPELISSLIPNVHRAHWIIRALCGTLHIYILLIDVEAWVMLFCYLLLMFLTAKDVLMLLW